MSDKPTRRSFFRHAGAALAAPLAASAAFAGQLDGRGYIPGRHDVIDVDAIRVLLFKFARLVGTGNDKAIAALFADAATRTSDGGHLRRAVVNGDDTISISSDGTATARVPCIVTTATPIVGDGTLVEMARLQGDGVVERTEQRMLVSELVKRDGLWQLVNAEFQA